MVVLNTKAFTSFVRYMYDENCHERSEHGQKPYPTAKAYLRKNRNFLESLYKQKKKEYRIQLKPLVPFCYNSYIMKKYLKFILGLTHKVGGSLPLHLRVGTNRSVTLIAADKVGLITGQFTKPLMRPIWIDSACRRFLNPTSFLKGVI